MSLARPFVHLNVALRADGSVSAADGSPAPISCAADWRRVHLLRESYDAVAVGAGTWQGDRPRLSARAEVIGRPPRRQPARVIFAGRRGLEIEPSSRRRTFVVGSRGQRGGDVHLRCEGHELGQALAALREHGIGSLLVEGGPTLLRSFVEQRAFDRFTAYVATRARRTAARALEDLLGGARLDSLGCEPLGDGLLLSFAGEAWAGPAWPRAPRLGAGLRGKLRHLEAGGPGGPRWLALLGPVPLPLRVQEQTRRFDWYVFAPVAAKGAAPDTALASSVLVFGSPRQDAPLVRLHSGCQTGDVFGSRRCDCGAQLEQALAEIVDEGAGLVLYLPEHEGRGIGLWAKAAAYLLQDQGCDTFEANRRLGLPGDARSYAAAGVVLGHFLPGRALRLLSNNPAKRDALAARGFDVVELRPLVAGQHEHNRRYLEAKARNGHHLPAELLRPPAPAVSGDLEVDAR